MKGGFPQRRSEPFVLTPVNFSGFWTTTLSKCLQYLYATFGSESGDERDSSNLVGMSDLNRISEYQWYFAQ